MTGKIENGLDVLRREARSSSGKHRCWKTHAALMNRAREHLEACGEYWWAWESKLSREFAELMNL